MKLRNKKSYITSLPEGTPPKNFRPRITQIIYYSILLFVVFYIVYIFGSRLFYFKASGFVEVNKTVLSATHGGRIIALRVKEGQPVRKKQLLATVAASSNCASTINLRFNKIKYDIALNQKKIAILNSEIDALEKRYNNTMLERALETGQSRNASGNKLKLDILKKQNALELLNSQTSLLKQELKNNKQRHLAANASADCFDENIYSPFNGYVYSVQHNADEFVQRGKALLTLIANNADVRIEAYLKTDQRPWLETGEIVDVSLSDDISTQARIKSIHSSAYNFPQRERDYYKPADTQVLVLLEPLSAKDAQLWKQYDRLKVTVRGRK